MLRCPAALLPFAIAALLAATLGRATTLAVQPLDAGPVNRFRVFVPAPAAGGPRPTLTCHYADGLRYRCAWRDVAATAAQAAHALVEVPDLGRGPAVQLQWSAGAQVATAAVSLRNPATLFHEIETVPLPAASANADPLRRETTATLPAAATAAAPPGSGCDRLQPHWEAATASDPLFIGPSGRLHGTVMPDPPVVAGSPLVPGNPARWLLTFPATATRAQFIVRYALVYRVGVCPERLLGGTAATRDAVR